MSTQKPINSFIWFFKKVCQDYQFIKSEDENYTKLSGPKLAEMASYHWNHMSDVEKQPYVEAVKKNQVEEIVEKSEISYVK